MSLSLSLRLTYLLCVHCNPRLVVVLSFFLFVKGVKSLTPRLDPVRTNETKWLVWMMQYGKFVHDHVNNHALGSRFPFCKR